MTEVETLLEAARKLSPNDKLRLVQDLWDIVAEEPKDLPVPKGVLEEVQRREEHLRQHPESALPWDEVVSRVRTRHGT